MDRISCDPVQNFGRNYLDPDPTHDVVEIPAGIIDTEIEIKPDKSVFTEQSYSWLELLSKIQRFTKSEIAEFRKRHGRKRYVKAN